MSECYDTHDIEAEESGMGLLGLIYEPLKKRFFRKKNLVNTVHCKRFYERWIPKLSHPSPQWVIYHGKAWRKGVNLMKRPETWLQCRLDKQEKLLANLH